MRRAFTLVEVVVSIVVLGVVAAVLLPLIGGVASAYGAAADTREKTERVAFAMDRCVRLLREAPVGADASTLDVVSATESSVLFGDGLGLETSGGVLMLRTPSGTAPLCRAVTNFRITYLATDGQTDTLGAPQGTHCFGLSLNADGVTLSSAVFPRCRMIKP